MDKKSCTHHILMVDFDAQTGVRNINENMKCLWPFGTGNRNEREERLLNFADENNLVVTNSFFQKAVNRYWTRKAPGLMTRNQTDFILSSDRKIVGNCEVITTVDVGSDHRMARARVEINKQLMGLQKIPKQTPLKSDLRVLEKSVTPFRIELKNRFDALKDKESTLENINKIKKESMDTLQNKTQKSTIKKSTEDTENERLDVKNGKKKKKPTESKQYIKRQCRVCRTQQTCEKET